MKLMLFVSMILATMAFTPIEKRPVGSTAKNTTRITGKYGAHNLDFSLVNMTGYDIRDIFVSPTTEKAWGDDIMGPEILPEGEAVDISFDAGETDRHWDIYVTWQGYDPSEDVFWIGLDLASISQVTIYYDATTGRTWAETK